ncbi:hypothetical protein [Amaricoccus sp.]|uniref:hypothetical protein n=1 Tax=Amaricoccus sp. TaxID=1872485 RepID=UPI001B405970|nr:hypothetical protein [Amaricoccus sp.]MBP7242486.1 hypothetical protein [Amaricoccus sp.]
MDNVARRHGRPGRWTPLLLYAAVVLGWFADGLAVDAAHERLWLVVWALPAPLLFAWRTRRR